MYEENLDGYKIWGNGGENKSLFLILLYQAAPRVKVFYTSMPQLVSVKGFHIWDVTRQREKGWAQSAEKLLDERKLCPMGISI